MGYNHPDSEGAYERAHLLTSKVGDVPELPRVLLGLARPRITKGDFPESTLALSREALAAGKTSRDTFFVLSAHQLLGSVQLFRGEFTQALSHLNQSIELYDPPQHRPLAHLVGYDQGPVAQRYAAWCLWLLGYPDQALALSRTALAQAQEGKHPLSIVLALASNVWIHFYRRELEETREAADVLIQACERFGIPAFIGPAIAFRGWARGPLGEAKAGLSDLQRSVAMHRELGWRIGEPVVLAMLGSSHAANGDFDEADRALREGLEVAEATHQHMHDAELYRLRGEFALAREPARPDVSEKLLLRALEAARRQEAKSFELRAAASLARLRQSQDRTSEARHLIAPVYDWFTEGFDTRDLDEVKALLLELG